MRENLDKGCKESDIMSLEHTQIVADIMDTVMHQVQVENKP